jgi:hypothetical protein
MKNHVILYSLLAFTCLSCGSRNFDGRGVSIDSNGYSNQQGAVIENMYFNGLTRIDSQTIQLGFTFTKTGVVNNNNFINFFLVVNETKLESKLLATDIYGKKIDLPNLNTILTNMTCLNNQDNLCIDYSFSFFNNPKFKFQIRKSGVFQVVSKNLSANLSANFDLARYDVINLNNLYQFFDSEINSSSSPGYQIRFLGYIDLQNTDGNKNQKNIIYLKGVLNSPPIGELTHYQVLVISPTEYSITADWVPKFDFPTEKLTWDIKLKDR